MAMAFIDAVAYLVRSAISQALGWDGRNVRPANQEHPRGTASDEFATVLLNNAVSRGQIEYEDEQIVDGDVVDATHIARHSDSIVTYTASVQFFKSKTNVDAAGVPHVTNRAYDFAVRLPQLMQHPEVRLTLMKYGLALQSTGNAQNLNALVNGTMWESRGAIELRFATVNRETFVLATYNVLRLGLLTASPSGQINTTPIEVTT